MNRRAALLVLGGLGLTAASIAMPALRAFRPARAGGAGEARVTPAAPASAGDAAGEPWALKLIAAAESQIGVTTAYDAAYERLAYPGGDVARTKGVCTDVIVRAYRDAHGLDLQKLVHEDMRAHFEAYPKRWGLKNADANIDHRRVPNLMTFFKRRGADLPLTSSAKDFAAGDLVTMILPGNLPHIALVSHRSNPDGTRPLLVHNIGAGTRLEDRLFEFPLDGHFRFKPV